MNRTLAALTRTFATASLGLVLSASALLAQQGLPAGTMAQQSLRPYWHVFIAYAIAIVLVLAWVISIARRLSALEKRLVD